MKKVLLIRPPFEMSLDYGGTMKLQYSGHEVELGLLYIAAYLERIGEIDVHFLDMSLYPDNVNRLNKMLDEHQYAMVGITGYTGFIKIANDVAGIVKKKSKAPVVIGGGHAAALPNQTMEKYLNFDYLVYAEGEKVFLELVNAKDPKKVKGIVYRNDDGTLTKNLPGEPIVNLDELPFPARHILDIKKYVPPTGNYLRLPSTGMIGSRGCYWSCTFCARSGSRLKNQVRFRSLPNLFAEMEICMKEYGVRDFRFYDDVFTYPNDRIIEFCNHIIKNNWDITWNCYSRVNNVTPEILSLMKKAGCYHIKYGVEYGTDKWAAITKKGANIQQARDAIKWTKKAGIGAKCSFILGMPGETLEEIETTIAFAKELNPTYATFGIYTPVPGSELFDNHVRDNELLHTDYDDFFTKDEAVVKGQLDLDILKKLVKKAYYSFYFRPRFVGHRINHLSKNFNFHEMIALKNGLKTIGGKAIKDSALIFS